MNQLKLTVKDIAGNTLCKIGTSIADPVDREYSDKELADVLTEMAHSLNESHKRHSITNKSSQ